MKRIADMKRTARPTFRPIRLGLAGAAGLLMTAAAAMAQAQAGAQGLEPPIPSPPLTAPSHPLMMGIAIVLLAMVVGANLIPSKRGHQD